ncbi:unnamed protein product, partial [Closterium sp. Yama58-4]
MLVSFSHRQRFCRFSLSRFCNPSPSTPHPFCSQIRPPFPSLQSTSLWWSVPQLPQHHKTNLFSVIAASITSLTRQQHSAAAAAAGVSAGAEGAAWGVVAGGGVSAEGGGVGMGSDGGGGVSDHTMLVQSMKLALAEMQVAGRSGTGSAQDIGSPLNVAVASVITAVAAASTALALDEVFCVPQPPLHLIADAFGQMAKNRPAVFRAMWPNVLRKIVPQLLTVTETTKHVFADAIAHWCRAFMHGQGMAVVLALQERRSREASGEGNQEGGAPLDELRNIPWTGHRTLNRMAFHVLPYCVCLPFLCIDPFVPVSALLQSAFDLFLQRWLLSSSSPARLSTAKAMAEMAFLLQESYLRSTLSALLPALRSLYGKEPEEYQHVHVTDSLSTLLRALLGGSPDPDGSGDSSSKSGGGSGGPEQRLSGEEQALSGATREADASAAATSSIPSPSQVLLPTLEFLLALIGHYTSRLSSNAADIRITITGLNTAMRCAMTITEAFPQHASAFAIQRAAHRGVDVRIRQGALVLLRRIVTSMPQVWAGNEEQFCQGAIYIVQSEEAMESAQDTSAQDIFALGMCCCWLCYDRWSSQASTASCHWSCNAYQRSSLERHPLLPLKRGNLEPGTGVPASGTCRVEGTASGYGSEGESDGGDAGGGTVVAAEKVESAEREIRGLSQFKLPPLEVGGMEGMTTAEGGNAGGTVGAASGVVEKVESAEREIRGLSQFKLPPLDVGGGSASGCGGRHLGASPPLQLPLKPATMCCGVAFPLPPQLPLCLLSSQPYRSLQVAAVHLDVVCAPPWSKSSTRLLLRLQLAALNPCVSLLLASASQRPLSLCHQVAAVHLDVMLATLEQVLDSYSVSNLQRIYQFVKTLGSQSAIFIPKTSSSSASSSTSSSSSASSAPKLALPPLERLFKKETATSAAADFLRDPLMHDDVCAALALTYRYTVAFSEASVVDSRIRTLLDANVFAPLAAVTSLPAKTAVAQSILTLASAPLTAPPSALTAPPPPLSSAYPATHLAPVLSTSSTHATASSQPQTTAINLKSRDDLISSCLHFLPPIPSSHPLVPSSVSSSSSSTSSPLPTSSSLASYASSTSFFQSPLAAPTPISFPGPMSTSVPNAAPGSAAGSGVGSGLGSATGGVAAPRFIVRIRGAGGGTGGAGGGTGGAGGGGGAGGAYMLEEEEVRLQMACVRACTALIRSHPQLTSAVRKSVQVSRGAGEHRGSSMRFHLGSRGCRVVVRKKFAAFSKLAVVECGPWKGCKSNPPHHAPPSISGITWQSFCHSGSSQGEMLEGAEERRALLFEAAVECVAHVLTADENQGRQAHEEGHLQGGTAAAAASECEYVGSVVSRCMEAVLRIVSLRGHQLQQQGESEEGSLQSEAHGSKQLQLQLQEERQEQQDRAGRIIERIVSAALGCHYRSARLPAFAAICSLAASCDPPALFRCVLQHVEETSGKLPALEELVEEIARHPSLGSQLFHLLLPKLIAGFNSLGGHSNSCADAQATITQPQASSTALHHPHRPHPSPAALCSRHRHQYYLGHLLRCPPAMPPPSLPCRCPSTNLQQAALPYTIPTVHTLHLLLCALAIDTIASRPEAALSPTGPLSKRINDAITAPEGGLWSSDPFLLVYGALRSVAHFFNHQPLIEALETYSTDSLSQKGTADGGTSGKASSRIDVTAGQLSVLCGLVAALVGAMLTAGEQQGDKVVSIEAFLAQAAECASVYKYITDAALICHAMSVGWRTNAPDLETTMAWQLERFQEASSAARAVILLILSKSSSPPSSVAHGILSAASLSLQDPSSMVSLAATICAHQ